jgi:hypothetical protein
MVAWQRPVSAVSTFATCSCHPVFFLFFLSRGSATNSVNAPATTTVSPSIWFRFHHTTLCAGPYPNDTMTLRRFVTAANAGPSGPRQIFQFGRTPTDYALHGHRQPCRGIYAVENLADALPMHADGAAACWVLAQTEVPRWLLGDSGDGAQITYAGWLLGTAGAGIGFHAHRDAVNAVVAGRKVWAIEATAEPSPPPPPPLHAAHRVRGARARAPTAATAAREHALDVLRGASRESSRAATLLQTVTGPVTGQRHG